MCLQTCFHSELLMYLRLIGLKALTYIYIALLKQHEKSDFKDTKKQAWNISLCVTTLTAVVLSQLGTWPFVTR